MSNAPILNATSQRARALEASRIRQIAEIGMGRDDLIPLWFGEGAWETTPLIIGAWFANDARRLAAGVDADQRRQSV